MLQADLQLLRRTTTASLYDSSFNDDGDFLRDTLAPEGLKFMFEINPVDTWRIEVQ